jgi:1-acyl-sn-glycerol-3-phosphate acyltransferase
MNHPSWWDPVLAFALSGFFPDRIPYAPMDARALARYPILGTIGLFGVGPDAAGARAFLEIGAAVLARPEAVLWVTPQGDFVDVRERPTRLRPGLGRLAARAPGVVVVPLAIEYAFWNERTPEAFAAFGRPVELDGAKPSGWTAGVARALGEAQDALAAAVVARDPARFRVMIAGGAGTGGVYGLWQRARSAFSGRPHRLEHDEERSAWR